MDDKRVYQDLVLRPSSVTTPPIADAIRRAGDQNRICQVFPYPSSTTVRINPSVVYSAFTHVSDPVSLTDTSEKKRCRGLPSTVPRCSVEIRRGPAFL